MWKPQGFCCCQGGITGVPTPCPGGHILACQSKRARVLLFLRRAGGDPRRPGGCGEGMPEERGPSHRSIPAHLQGFRWDPVDG